MLCAGASVARGLEKLRRSTPEQRATNARDTQLRTVFSAEQYGTYLALKQKLREHLESKLAGGAG